MSLLCLQPGQPKCDFNPWEIWNIKNYWALLQVTYFLSQNINSPKVQERSFSPIMGKVQSIYTLNFCKSR